MVGIVNLLGAVALASSVTAQSSSATIPEYVLTYAPLVYLDVNEEYYPSDIGAQVTNTYPDATNFTRIANVPSNLSLSDLSVLNSLGRCTSFGDCRVWLTSKEMVTARPPSPQWLYGVLPNPVTGETEGATSCVVIVRDHGNGTVDAFYMYFYAFNWGIPIPPPNGTVFGNHVGDWEHQMVRFNNGQPVSVYFSQHSGGEAYTYEATVKNGSRPLGFASLGGHATYAQEGVHPRIANIANDSTSRGPLWDPVAGSGAWYYTFTPESADSSNGTFIPVNVQGRTSRGTGPTSFLYYLGKWGDQQYNSSYPGQASIGSLTSVFEDGPTGPLDKDLNRNEICPGNGTCVTTTVVPTIISQTAAQTVSRTYTPVTTTTSSGHSSSSPTGNAASSNPRGSLDNSVTAVVLSIGLWVCII